VFDGSAILANAAALPVQLQLVPDNGAPSRIVVRFLTPTELKSGNQVVHDPGFSVLFARVRDRISSLAAFYGGGPLKVNFRSLSEQASCVQMVRSRVERRHLERRSSRTGQTHPLGGFTGEAEYEGDLREIMPFLRAAEWTGVGRHTVWGQGAIRVSAVSGRN
jgi:CRISPR/Cas system endoribonuclease Cas6 (RAMP superfamily)